MTQTQAPTYYSRRVVAYVSDLWRRREFAWFLALGNFKARNASTALGLFWWILNPLLLSLVYYLVFGLIFPGARDIIYLMSGMFVFHFTAQSLTGGANSILQNSKLLANLKFPRLILPLAGIIESGIGFVVSLGVLLVLNVVIPPLYIPGASLLLLLAAVPLHVIFNLGLASMSGRLAVPFRDINNFIPYLTRVWLYLSPIIWPVSFLEGKPEVFIRLAEANPMYAIISVYRTALLGEPFDATMFTSFAVWSIVIGVVGVGMFVRYEGKIARHL
jgi:teichoic acid transport system permease protein